MHLHILTLSKLDTPNFKKAKQITPNNHRKTIIFNKQYIVNTYVNKTSVTSSPYGGADNHGVNRKSVSISGVAHPVFIDYPCDTVAHQTGMDRSSSQQLVMRCTTASSSCISFFPASLCIVLSSMGVEPASSSHWRVYSAQSARSTILLKTAPGFVLMPMIPPWVLVSLLMVTSIVWSCGMRPHMLPLDLWTANSPATSCR